MWRFKVTPGEDLSLSGSLTLCVSLSELVSVVTQYWQIICCMEAAIQLIVSIESTLGSLYIYWDRTSSGLLLWPQVFTAQLCSFATSVVGGGGGGNLLWHCECCIEIKIIFRRGCVWSQINRRWNLFIISVPLKKSSTVANVLFINIISCWSCWIAIHFRAAVMS